MWTDRCHRICTKCSHANDSIGEPPAALGRDVRLVLERTGEGRYWGASGLVALAALTEE